MHVDPHGDADLDGGSRRAVMARVVAALWRPRRLFAAGLAGVCVMATCFGVAMAQSQAPIPTPRYTSHVEIHPIAPSAIYADIPLAGADAGAPTVPSAPDAWGGERRGDEPTLSDRVVSYRIAAELDAVRHRVSGIEHLTWRNRSDRPVSRVYFHLYLNAFQNTGSIWFTERGTFAGAGGDALPKPGEWGWIDVSRIRQGETTLRSEFVHPDGGPATDQTVLRVDLAEPLAAGATVALDIDFTSQLPRVLDRSGWQGDFNFVAQWFPKIGVLELPGERGATAPRWNVHAYHLHSEFYADFGLYDVELTVPDGYVVGAVGEQQGEPRRAHGKATYHFVQGDVHDFAWVAAKGYKVLEGNWQGAGSPKVAVRVLYPQDYAASAQPSLKATIAALEYFSKSLGPYPYRTVTVVVPPYRAAAAGGMEYPTFFTVAGYRHVKARTAAQYHLDAVNIHEFGHGYFYGILASNEFEEPFLDEGMNAYWDARMLHDRGEQLHPAPSWLRQLGIDPALSAFVARRWRAGLRQPADPLGQNSWERLSSRSYGTVYSRTVTAMHDLEQRVGREAMERGMREYYRRWRFRHPSAADLRAALADGTGDAQAVDDIFDHYVYGTDFIDDKVAAITAQRVSPPVGSFLREGKRVFIAPGQDAALAAGSQAGNEAGSDAAPEWRSTVTVQRAGAAVPQLLRVHFADGSQRDVQWQDARRWARFDFVAPSKVVAAELDPKRAILLDADKLNDSHAVQADGAPARRWSADVAALLQAFYALLGTW
jgi:hypothetical protein